MNVQRRNTFVKQLGRIQSLFGEIAGNGLHHHTIGYLREWIVCRELTLRELDKFQKELDRIHVCGNTTRVVGGGAAVLGSVATIIGFGLSFSKGLKPFGDELMKYGSTVGKVGCAATATATLAEVGFNMKVLNDVKKALQRDSQQTELLLPLFKRTKELDAALKAVFGCGLTNDFNEILATIRDVHTLVREGGKTWGDVRDYLLSQGAKTLTVNTFATLDNAKLEKILSNTSYKIQQLLVEFCNSPLVRDATWKIHDCFKNNPVSFVMAKMSIRIMGKATVHQNALVASMGAQSFMQTAGLTLQGVFKTVNFAISVFAFVSALKDIGKERSKYYDAIEKTKSCLLKELQTVKSNTLDFEDEVSLIRQG